MSGYKVGQAVKVSHAYGSPHAGKIGVVIDTGWTGKSSKISLLGEDELTDWIPNVALDHLLKSAEQIWYEETLQQELDDCGVTS